MGAGVRAVRGAGLEWSYTDARRAALSRKPSRRRPTVWGRGAARRTQRLPHQTAPTDPGAACYGACATPAGSWPPFFFGRGRARPRIKASNQWLFSSSSGCKGDPPVPDQGPRCRRWLNLIRNLIIDRQNMQGVHDEGRTEEGGRCHLVSRCGLSHLPVCMSCPIANYPTLRNCLFCRRPRRRAASLAPRILGGAAIARGVRSLSQCVVWRWGGCRGCGARVASTEDGRWEPR